MSSYQIAKNLSMKSRSIAYLPNLSTLLQRLRTSVHFPTSPAINGNMPLPVLASDWSHDSLYSLKDRPNDLAPKTVFPEKYRSVPIPLSVDRVFPLPSHTGVSQTGTETETKLDTATQYVTIDGLLNIQSLKFDNKQIEIPSVESKVEVLVQESPSFLLNSFMELMPDLPELTDSKLSVVCVSEHTSNDMSKWSHDMSQEREELTLNFINSAKEICGRIQEFGFWADFIDPSSGRPYLGVSGSDHLTELDDRMRHFGFTIEDLGCCKCLRHTTWGTNVFVGVILTTAPTNSSIITNLMNL